MNRRRNSSRYWNVVLLKDEIKENCRQFDNVAGRADSEAVRTSERGAADWHLRPKAAHYDRHGTGSRRISAQLSQTEKQSFDQSATAVHVHRCGVRNGLPGVEELHPSGFSRPQLPRRYDNQSVP